MIEKLLEHLPYHLLERVKFLHLLLAGAGVGLLLFSAYFFTLYQSTHEELVQKNGHYATLSRTSLIAESRG